MGWGGVGGGEGGRGVGGWRWVRSRGRGGGRGAGGAGRGPGSGVTLEGVSAAAGRGQWCTGGSPADRRCFGDWWSGGANSRAVEAGRRLRLGLIVSRPNIGPGAGRTGNHSS